MSVEASPPLSSDVERRARALAALADPARLRVLDALVLGDTSPGDLGSRLGLSSSLLAHHLGVLERVGLLARQRSQADRRRSYLRLVPDALDDLLPGLGTSALAPEDSVTRVVFVCTANSARSQLAAALWTRNSTVPATSAGTHPAPAIAPGAAAVAKRHGLTLARTIPRLLPDLTEADYLVTVCDNAFEDLTNDDALTRPRHRLHWSVPDPVRVGGKRAFEDAYADLEGRVVTLARHLAPAHDISRAGA
ncbi:MAG: transcriptional regulator, MarR family [Marmoricola sp.]|nr:transcriptional regulator, MarR family [Marmoricola sp.]